jgi:hypothetical protein
MRAKLPEEQRWINAAGQACFLSLLVFSIGGALLSLAYLELLYFVLALVCILDTKIKQLSQQPALAND